MVLGAGILECFRAVARCTNSHEYWETCMIAITEGIRLSVAPVKQEQVSVKRCARGCS